MSSLFPFFGGVSVLLASFLGDRLGRVGRAVIILTGVSLGGLTLGLLGSVSFAGRLGEPLVLMSLAAFLVIGPYFYLAGAISLDFAGKRASAIACGIIDGIGYLFDGVIADNVVSTVSGSLEWQGVFQMLAVVAFLTGAAATSFLVTQLRHVASGPEALLAIP
jgi:sugar phosphate permease